MKVVSKVGRARSYGDLETTNLPNTGSKQTNKQTKWYQFVKSVTQDLHSRKAIFVKVFIMTYYDNTRRR